ncbi:MAG: hypothetical protein AB7N29_03435 [Vicinamibacterales bacterium]
MKTFAIGMLALALLHGGAAAQTTQEQDRILREFEQNVASLAVASPITPVFTLPVSAVFRQVIAKTLDERVHVTHMSAVGSELPLAHHPAIRERFPTTELHEFPALLERALPPLPPALEYRLIGNDLVLREVKGNVIVAVLRDAVGRTLAVKY